MQTEKVEPLPIGIELVATGASKDCNTACGNRSPPSVCFEGPLPALESCDVLREYFECEAGCTQSTVKATAPAYVVYGTPKPQFPTMCFALAPGTKLQCRAEDGAMRRLCACKVTS
jgi:hypothetical protein